MAKRIFICESPIKGFTMADDYNHLYIIICSKMGRSLCILEEEVRLNLEATRLGNLRVALGPVKPN